MAEDATNFSINDILHYLFLNHDLEFAYENYIFYIANALNGFVLLDVQHDGDCVEVSDYYKHPIKFIQFAKINNKSIKDLFIEESDKITILGVY